VRRPIATRRLPAYCWPLRPRCEGPRRRAAEQRDELAPFHQQLLPWFEAEDSTGGGLPHCGISKEPLSALGHFRQIDTLPALAACLLCPESGQTGRRLTKSA
jgi:hypothetical protein